MQQWPGPIVGMMQRPGGGRSLVFNLGTLRLRPSPRPSIHWPGQVLIPSPWMNASTRWRTVDRPASYRSGHRQANGDRPDIMTPARWPSGKFTPTTALLPTPLGRPRPQLGRRVQRRRRAGGGFPRRYQPGGRDEAIAGFRNGSVKVLVNVIVATEGFDLPDASCIIISRPL